MTGSIGQSYANHTPTRRCNVQTRLPNEMQVGFPYKFWRYRALILVHVLCLGGSASLHMHEAPMAEVALTHDCSRAIAAHAPGYLQHGSPLRGVVSSQL